MSDSRLIERLTALRRKVRRRLVLFGVCSICSSVLAGFLLLVLLDWWLWMPPAVRLVVGLAFVAGGIAATVHWLIRPLREQVSISQLAAKLEEYHWPLENSSEGLFEDRLSSTVQFLLGDQAGSEEMRRKVIANTDRIVRRIQFADALSSRPLLVRAASVGVILLALVLVVQVWPAFAATGARRYATPFSGLEWPREVEILSLSQDASVPVGEALTLRMRIVRGLSSTLRPMTYLRSPQGEISRLAMQREGEADYTCTVAPITEDLVCWFVAGDDETSDDAISIRVVRRPAITEALLAIVPPAYAPEAPTVVVDLDAGEIAAVKGSMLEVSLRTSKPIRSSDSSRAEAAIAFTSGDTAPLRFASGDSARRDELEGTFKLDEDADFRFHVVDDHGFENHGARRYRVRAEDDQMPGVVLLEPRGVTEITPDGSVSLLVRAEDDFGINSMRILGRRLDSDEPFEIPLAHSVTPGPAGERVLALAEHVWQLAPLQLQPGAVLAFFAEASDNFAGTEGPPQIGRSSELRLKIISAAAFDNRLRDELRLLQDRLRQTMLDQQTLKDDTEALAGEAAEDGSIGDIQSDSAAGLSHRQARLGQGIRDVSRRLQRVRNRLKLSSSASADRAAIEQRVALLIEELSATATGPVASASRGLGQAAEPGNSEARQLLERAAGDQQATIDALRRTVRLMDQWGDFQEVVNKTRDLLDRQQALRAATTEQGRRTLGQRPEDLSGQQQTRLRQVQRQQSQLADETEALVGRMQRLADGSRAKDPAGADALQQATRAAVASDVTERMRQAAEAVGANRTAAALIDQRTAQSALTSMLEGLQERQQRELAELAKRLESFEQAVAGLLRQQRDLRGANEEAQRLEAEDDTYVGLASPQRRLKRNATRLADDMEELSSRGPAADRSAENPAQLVRQSAAPMAKAESALTRAEGPRAGAYQTQAIDLLAQAAAELEELARRTREEASRQSMGALRAKLEGIRDTQQDINDQTLTYIDRLAEKKRLSRADNRRVVRLARTQEDLHQPVQAVRGELGDAEVYTWVIDRVLGLIGKSGDALRARRLNQELSGDQQQVVAELDLLISALAEAAALPSADEYAEGGGGGGGGQQGADDGSPIPGVAELLVLKAMQLDVNARTAKLGGDFSTDDATESDLRELRRLGERQRKIQELALTVTRRAKAGSAPGG